MYSTFNIYSRYKQFMFKIIIKKENECTSNLKVLFFNDF